MSRYFVIGLVGTAVLLTSGCATRYRVGVTSYLSHSLSFPEPTQDTKVAVVAESEPDEPLLEEEVRRKLESLVSQHGYSIADVDQADYILSAFFAIDAGTTCQGAPKASHSEAPETPPL